MEPHGHAYDEPQLWKPAWTDGGGRLGRPALLSGSTRVGREFELGFC